MDKAAIQTEIEESGNGIYSVRLFVPADSPDNLDHQVSTGWVDLDLNSMKAYDVTESPEDRKILYLDQEKYEAYVRRCILTVDQKIKDR